MKSFDSAEIGPGFKRGMVLKIYKAKIKELTDKKTFLNDLKYTKLKPESGKGYDNPTLFIYFQPGSPWITEPHARRYQLKMLLNKRLKSEFIKEVSKIKL